MEKKKACFVVLCLALTCLASIGLGNTTTKRKMDDGNTLGKINVIAPSASPIMTYTNDFSYPKGQSGNLISFTKPTSIWPYFYDKYSLFKDGVNISHGSAVGIMVYKTSVDNLNAGEHTFQLLWLNSTLLFGYSPIINVYVFQNSYNLSITSSTTVPKGYSLTVNVTKASMGYSSNGRDILIQWFNATSNRWDMIDIWNETSFSLAMTQIWFALQSIINSPGDTSHYRILTDCWNMTGLIMRNGSNIFPFFDEFNGYSLGAINGQGGWTVYNPGGINTMADIQTFKYNKKMLVLNSNSAGNFIQATHKIKSSATDSNYYIIEAFITSTSASQSFDMAFSDGTHTGSNDIINGYDASFNWGGNQLKIQLNGGGGSDIAANSFQLSGNKYYKTGFRWTDTGNNLQAITNLTQQLSGSDSNWHAHLFSNFALYTYETFPNCYWDVLWVRIRTAYSTQPTVAVGLKYNFPFANFTTDIHPAYYGEGQSVQFTFTGNGTSPTYHWNFYDSFSSSLQNPSHKFAAAGNYSVTLNVTDSCGYWDVFSSNVTIVGITSIISRNGPGPFVGGMSFVIRVMFWNPGSTMVYSISAIPSFSGYPSFISNSSSSINIAADTSKYIDFNITISASALSNGSVPIHASWTGTAQSGSSLIGNGGTHVLGVAVQSQAKVSITSITLKVGTSPFVGGMSFVIRISFSNIGGTTANGITASPNFGAYVGLSVTNTSNVIAIDASATGVIDFQINAVTGAITASAIINATWAGTEAISSRSLNGNAGVNVLGVTIQSQANVAITSILSKSGTSSFVGGMTVVIRVSFSNTGGTSANGITALPSFGTHPDVALKNASNIISITAGGSGFIDFLVKLADNATMQTVTFNATWNGIEAISGRFLIGNSGAHIFSMAIQSRAAVVITGISLKSGTSPFAGGTSFVIRVSLSNTGGTAANGVTIAPDFGVYATLLVTNVSNSISIAPSNTGSIDFLITVADNATSQNATIGATWNGIEAISGRLLNGNSSKISLIVTTQPKPSNITFILILVFILVGVGIAVAVAIPSVRKKRLVNKKGRGKSKDTWEPSQELMPDTKSLDRIPSPVKTTPKPVAIRPKPETPSPTPLSGVEQRMHDILFGEQAIWEPIELATELGFKSNPEVFYSFVTALNGDTMRFYAGKILIDVNADASKKEEIFQQLQVFFQ
ncbi:MAG TPA: PKD domain-containing protein [Candidatus Lokiarchaeia archaeon]|nr:PKD domain-containing protein [Candidatus Lokiarchaeia archaeon]